MAAYPESDPTSRAHLCGKFKEIFDTDKLPEFVELPAGVKKSRLNVYGVTPQDLNGPERAFADLLDADTTGTVDYWFRNEPRKPWSIGIVMPSGDRYFPDFAVKVAGHAAGVMTCSWSKSRASTSSTATIRWTRLWPITRFMARR